MMGVIVPLTSLPASPHMHWPVQSTPGRVRADLCWYPSS